MREGSVVRVRGLKEMQRDFARISKDVRGEVDAALIEAADPVRDAAEQLAMSEIRNMPSSPNWAGMRIGVARASSTVYMVPDMRRRRRSKKKVPRLTSDGWRMVRPGPRTNLADLLMERAMDPALERNEERVTKRIDDALGHLFDRNGF